MLFCVFIDVLLTFLGKLGDQPIYAEFQEMQIHFFVAFELERHLFSLVVPQGPIEYQQVQLLANLLQLCCDVKLRNPDSNHALNRVSHKCFSVQILFFVKKMNDWEFQLTFADQFHYFMVERLYDDWQTILSAFFFSVKTASLKYLDKLFNQQLVPVIVSIFPQTFDLNQEPTFVSQESLLFNILYLSDHIFQSRYFKGHVLELRTLFKGLFDFKQVELLDSEIVHPPILSGALTLLDIVR